MQRVEFPKDMTAQTIIDLVEDGKNVILMTNLSGHLTPFYFVTQTGSGENKLYTFLSITRSSNNNGTYYQSLVIGSDKEATYGTIQDKTVNDPV